MNKNGQILLPFLRRETFFTGRIHMQIRIPFPYMTKELAGVRHQQHLFPENTEKSDSVAEQVTPL